MRGWFARDRGVVLDGVDGGGLVMAVEGRPGADVAEAWRRWGPGLVEHLPGTFALAVWDAQARRGVLARDRLGARALYLCESGGRLWFADEPTRLPHGDEVDDVALVHWLAASDVRGGRTLFSRVRRLGAGELVELGPEGTVRRRWWAPRYEEPLREPREELAARLRDAVVGATARAAAGDHPVGVLLSGGLDSGSVLAGAVAASLPARAYSAVFPTHPSLDERPLIEAVTGELGVPRALLAVRRVSMLAGALEHMRRWEVPLISPNDVIWQELLRRAAADGAGVVLDGEGGDFVFGAVRQLMADRIRSGRPWAAVRLARSLPGAGDHPSRRILARLVVRDGLLPTLPGFLGLDRPGRPAPTWLRPEARKLFSETDDPAPWRELDGPRWWAYLADALTNGMEALDLYGHMRRRAAGAGLAAAQPLLDREVVELVLRLPPETAYDRHLSRPLLREAMAGLLPDAIRLRARKAYFDAVIHDSLTGPDLPLLRRLLLAPDARIRRWTTDEGLARLAAGPPPGLPESRAWALDAWRAATAELWLRHRQGESVDDPPPDPPDWSWD